jgi:hypothetical protein
MHIFRRPFVFGRPHRLRLPNQLQLLAPLRRQLPEESIPPYRKSTAIMSPIEGSADVRHRGYGYRQAFANPMHPDYEIG